MENNSQIISLEDNIIVESNDKIIEIEINIESAKRLLKLNPSLN
jgi:hypothetical protein